MIAMYSTLPAELPCGTVIEGTYEVGARMSSGSMGEIYAARHIRLGRQVSVKVIKQGASGDVSIPYLFAIEAQALARIQHPAVVAIHHIGRLDEGRDYFVMEFLQGEMLADRLVRGQPSFTEGLHILDQVAQGLAAAHGQGVVHRDLKPENVFLEAAPGGLPFVKIIDFGLAQIDNEASAEVDAEMMKRGVTVGTPMCMSPEQFRAPRVDGRADIYALGGLAYEVLLGRHPFPHVQTLADCQIAHSCEVPPHPRTIRRVPSHLGQLLFSMLAKDPTQRPSLARVREVIAAVKAPRQGRRERYLIGALAAALLLILTLAALATRTILEEGKSKGDRTGMPECSAPQIRTGE